MKYPIELLQIRLRELKDAAAANERTGHPNMAATQCDNAHEVRKAIAALEETPNLQQRLIERTEASMATALRDAETIRRLTAALNEIAAQESVDDMGTKDYLNTDFSEIYDECVITARRALHPPTITNMEYEFITATVDDCSLSWRYKLKDNEFNGSMDSEEDVTGWTEEDIIDLIMGMLGVPWEQRSLIKIEYA